MRIPAILSLILLASCAHPYRISRGTLGRLTASREPFVLVFGSLAATADTPGAPMLRFSHAASKLGPEFPLMNLEIPHGGKFYAVLQPPKNLPHIDEFYVEVGNVEAGFDKIVYLRVRQTEGPQAMYLGEITMSNAHGENIRGHMLKVNVRDDFQNASRDLRREYPRYSGPVGKGLAVRSAPNSPAPPRVH